MLKVTLMSTFLVKLSLKDNLGDCQLEELIFTADIYDSMLQLYSSINEYETSVQNGIYGCNICYVPHLHNLH